MSSKISEIYWWPPTSRSQRQFQHSSLLYRQDNIYLSVFTCVIDTSLIKSKSVHFANTSSPYLPSPPLKIVDCIFISKCLAGFVQWTTDFQQSRFSSQISGRMLQRMLQNASHSPRTGNTIYNRLICKYILPACSYTYHTWYDNTRKTGNYTSPFPK